MNRASPVFTQLLKSPLQVGVAVHRRWLSCRVTCSPRNGRRETSCNGGSLHATVTVSI
jgi:hypothetical protein